MRLYVRNIPYEATDQDLREHFEAEFDSVTNARIVMDLGTNRSRGFGFVTLTDRTDYLDALHWHTELFGRKLGIEEAKK